jgi:peptidase C13-like protein
MVSLGRLGMQAGLRLVSKVAGLWLAVFAVTAVIPHAPVLLPSNFDARKWEILSPLHAEEGGALSRGEIAQIQKAQSSLLQREFAGLAASHRGETEIYTLAIAGWADNVFIKELDGGSAAIASVLPIKGTVRLINHRKTVNTVPLANFQNFRQAVHAIGSIMDKDNDVLILLMTSHGDRTGFALQLPGSITELTPRQVAAALDGEGIKNRVVIVSACYSGIFVPPLANDNTIVMTAADAHHSSFGCAPERDWTYFGDAFFRQSLRPGVDFENAFDHARVLIHRWEMRDGAVPSNPQARFGRGLVGKLARFFATNPGQ